MAVPAMMVGCRPHIIIAVSDVDLRSVVDPVWPSTFGKSGLEIVCDVVPSFTMKAFLLVFLLMSLFSFQSLRCLTAMLSMEASLLMLLVLLSPTCLLGRHVVDRGGILEFEQYWARLGLDRDLVVLESDSSCFRVRVGLETKKIVGILDEIVHPILTMNWRSLVLGGFHEVTMEHAIVVCCAKAGAEDKGRSRRESKPRSWR